MIVLTPLLWVGSAVQSHSGAPGPDPDAAERGRALVGRLCSRCHAVGAMDQSPFDPAPPFRDIANRYRIDDLAEAFGEGIEVGHAAMPVFEFSPETIGEVLEYLRSLK